MLLDSLAAFVLFAASLTAWRISGGARASSRVNIRFAAMLFAALGVAQISGLIAEQFMPLKFSVALIAAPLGGTALMLGVFAFLARPLPAGVAALAMALALGAGLASSLSGVPAYAGLCLVAGVLVTMAAGLGALPQRPAQMMPALVSALAVLCGALCLMAAALNVAELFFAASLIGAASQKRASAQRESGARAAITRAG